MATNFLLEHTLPVVIPAKAGIHVWVASVPGMVSSCAGMTYLGSCLSYPRKKLTLNPGVRMKRSQLSESIECALPAQYIPYVRYSEAFKRKVVSEIDTGRLSRNAAKRIYHVKSWNSVDRWCRQYSKYTNMGARVEVRISDEPTLSQLQQEKRALERELAFARLKITALETLIDLAEQDGVEIRKNVGTKQ
jgi:transposase